MKTAEEAVLAMLRKSLKDCAVVHLVKLLGEDRRQDAEWLAGRMAEQFDRVGRAWKGGPGADPQACIEAVVLAISATAAQTVALTIYGADLADRALSRPKFN